jgi:hypothetical protein
MDAFSLPLGFDQSLMRVSSLARIAIRLRSLRRAPLQLGDFEIRSRPVFQFAAAELSRLPASTDRSRDRRRGGVLPLLASNEFLATGGRSGRSVNAFSRRSSKDIVECLITGRLICWATH